MNKGTSFNEQAIYYYIRKFFPDAINRYRLNDTIHGLLEADIFLPKQSIAIEYDGFYYHKDRVEHDDLKNRVFNSYGIYVIRVRDSGLPPLPAFNGRIFVHGSNANELHMNNIISAVVQLVATFHGSELSLDASTFSLSYDDYRAEKPIIYSNIYTKLLTKGESVDCCGIRWWNYKKNGNLLPQNVPKSSRIPVWFTCPASKDVLVSLEYLMPLSACKHNDNCVYCAYQVCPFLLSCGQDEVIECSVIEKAVLDYLHDKRSILYHLDNLGYLLCSNRATIKAIEARVHSKVNITKFDELFIYENKYNGSHNFLGGRTIFAVCEPKDLELIKQLYKIYPELGLRLSASQFDTSNESRTALMNYIKWFSEKFSRAEGSVINGLFYESIVDKKLSKQFGVMLRDYLRVNPRIHIYGEVSDFLNKLP